MGATVVMDLTVYRTAKQSIQGERDLDYVIPSDIAEKCMTSLNHAIGWLERAEDLKVEYAKVDWVKSFHPHPRIQPRFHLKIRLLPGEIREMWACPFWEEANRGERVDQSLPILVKGIVEGVIEGLQEKVDGLSREKTILEKALDKLRTVRDDIKFSLA